MAQQRVYFTGGAGPGYNAPQLGGSPGAVIDKPVYRFGKGIGGAVPGIAGLIFAGVMNGPPASANPPTAIDVAMTNASAYNQRLFLILFGVMAAERLVAGFDA